jgi:hypothetical protein
VPEDPTVVEPDEPLEPVAAACPEKPIAAIAENTAVRTNETAAVIRVARDTDRIPFSRARPTCGPRRCRCCTSRSRI